MGDLSVIYCTDDPLGVNERELLTERWEEWANRWTDWKGESGKRERGRTDVYLRCLSVHSCGKTLGTGLFQRLHHGSHAQPEHYKQPDYIQYNISNEASANKW